MPRREYYQAHKEEIKEYVRSYRQNHPEQTHNYTRAPNGKYKYQYIEPSYALDQISDSKFWNKVEIKSIEECWEWQKYKYPTGYGHTSAKYGNYAHRYAYISKIGRIPDGMNICHKCDNPACCNPSHLFLGTVADNMRDRDEKDRNGTRKIDKKAVIEIRHEWKNSYHWGLTTELSEKYGITSSQIFKIIHFLSWKNISQN